MLKELFSLEAVDLKCKLVTVKLPSSGHQLHHVDARVDYTPAIFGHSTVLADYTNDDAVDGAGAKLEEGDANLRSWSFASSFQPIRYFPRVENTLTVKIRYEKSVFWFCKSIKEKSDGRKFNATQSSGMFAEYSLKGEHTFSFAG